MDGPLWLRVFTFGGRTGCSRSLLRQLADDLQHLRLPQQPVQGVHLLAPQGTEGAQLLQGTAVPGTSGTQLTAHTAASMLWQDTPRGETHSPPQGFPPQDVSCHHAPVLTSSRQLQLLR